MKQMGFDALADFVLVATYGGLGKAARSTGRSKATLSRKLSDLEDALQVRLVERGTSTLKLTAEGEALFARSRGPLADLLQAGDDVRSGGSKLSGLLRITAPLLFSHVALSRAAAEFSQLHPEIEIEINAEDRFVDPVEEGYDLVIRTNPKPTENMVGRRLFTDELVLVATPGVPNPPGGGTVDALLMSRLGEVRDWTVATGNGSLTYRPRPVMRLSSIMMVYEAVMAGRGAAILPWSLVGGEVANGRLMNWGHVVNRPVEVWVLHASSRLSSPKVTTFASFLAEQFPGGRLKVSRPHEATDRAP